MRIVIAALAASFLLGCGQSQMPGHPSSAVVRGKVSTRVQSDTSHLSKAFEAARAFATQSWGGKWELKRAFSQRGFDASGQAQAVSWQLNLYSPSGDNKPGRYVRLLVSPQGVVTPDPRDQKGPFQDPWNTQRLPSMTPAQEIPVEKAVKLALATRFGTKYPPMTPISYEAGYIERLKVMGMRFRWSCTIDRVVWYLEVVLDPVTGEVIELDASKLD